MTQEIHIIIKARRQARGGAARAGNEPATGDGQYASGTVGRRRPPETASGRRPDPGEFADCEPAGWPCPVRVGSARRHAPAGAGWPGRGRLGSDSDKR